VDRQERECRELAERQGWEVSRVYVDNDTSAYAGKPRPEYLRLLEDLAAGTVDAVLAWHPDRLYRHPRDLERFVDTVQKAGAPVATVTAGDLDLATPAGRAVARTLGAWARYEGEQKAERHRAKDRQLAENGRPHGGARIYGYRYVGGNLHIVPNEARIVRELAKRLLAGESVHELARDLTTRGILTARGIATWHHNTVSRLMKNPTLAGLRTRKDDTTRPGDWEPILTMDEHRALVALLTDPARLSSREPRRYLLTGIAVCGLCGSGLMARPKMDRRRNYLCRACHKIGVLAEPLEELVVAAVFERVEGRDFTAHLQTTRQASPVEAIEAQLAELAQLWAAKEITRTEWLAARAPLQGDLQREREAVRQDERQQARLRALDGYEGGALRAAWNTMDLSRRRAILRALMSAVVVGPAVPGRNRFDPNRVSVRWCA
jgi:DNA invertase Pin-like site-specific DNA recombinase